MVRLCTATWIISAFAFPQTVFARQYMDLSLLGRVVKSNLVTVGVHVARNVSPPTAGVYLDYQNIHNGSLRINGTSLECITILSQPYITEIIAPNVEFITESIYIVDLPLLKRLWFPKLREVKGISIRDAPLLSQLSGNFSPGNRVTLTSTADDEYNGNEKLVISNTAIKALSLNSVPGVGLGDGTIQILNNPYLEKFTLSGLVRGPREIEVSDNGAKLKTRTQVSFPDLETSWQLDINFASRINIPQLRNSSGTLRLWKSTMKNLELPTLINAGAVVILLNPKLERIEMPVFETTIRYAEGDGTGYVLGIYDNDKLTSWTAPPRYRPSPGGETVLYGNFKNITLNPTFPLPIREENSPGFHIVAYDANFDCSPFDVAAQRSWDSGTGNPSTVLGAHYSCRIDRQL